MDRIFTVLPSVLNKRGLTEHALGSLMVHRIKAWVAHKLPDIAAVVHVQKYQDGTVYISCAHSAALQECRAVLGDLREYLHVECAFAPTVDIRLSRD